MTRDEFKRAFRDYDSISSTLKTHGYEENLNTAAELANASPEAMEAYPICGYSVGMTSGTYRFTLLDLLKNVQHYDWLYSRLADNASRMVFANLVAYRLFPSPNFLKTAYDGKHPQYFDKGIVSCDENEVFVDCGGSAGDTTEKFIQQFEKYKRIYVYEPGQGNIPTCMDNLSKCSGVTIRHCSVEKKRTRWR